MLERCTKLCIPADWEVCKLQGTDNCDLFVCTGSAEATKKKCPKFHKDCNPRKPGCETCVEKDVNNCGDCRKKCETLPYTRTWCAGGKCRYKCKDGFGNCDNNLWRNGCETRLSNDAKNCGCCRKACKQVPYAAASKCVKGKCSEPVCNFGRGNCDKNIWSNGCEVNLATDVKNCGRCGNKCPDTLVGGEPYCR